MKRSILKTFLGAAATLLVAACSNSKGVEGNVSNHADEVVDGQSLALPTVPLSLTDPHDRAAYVLDHFWDALDFGGDTLRSHNQGFLEQSFSNFISLFPLVDSIEQKRAAEHLLQLARVDTASFRLVRHITFKYLYEPNSPMLNEDYYAVFLPALIADNRVSEVERERYRFDLSCIGKNRQGYKATDFTYLGTDGKKRTLFKTPTEEQLMLMFYDPDCEECQNTLAALRSSEVLNGLIAEKKVTVLAVCTEGDEEQWHSTLSQLAPTWIAGYDKSGINEHNLYILRAMPTIYLLNKEKCIVRKDILANQALQVLLGPDEEEERPDLQ